MDTTGVIQCIVLLVLVFLSAFFSSAETAFSTVSGVRIRSLEEEGNKKAKVVNKILSQYGKMISAILIGNNIVNIAASALATMLAIKINIIVGIASGLLTIVILIFGEVIPKTWAKLNNERITLVYCDIILFIMTVLTPFIFLIDKISLGIMKLLHIDPNKKTETITESELKTYVDVGHEDGVIETEEKEIIYNVFDFSDAIAKEIMIPRINMVTIPDDATYQEVMDVFSQCMYTRLPVYHEDKDNIIAFINMKDFILVKDRDKFTVADIQREPHFTYEYKKSSDLLMEMRKLATNLSFVVNEYGVTVGMITLEDLLEEIVGEIRDEFDADEEENIKELGEREYLVVASMKLDDINDAIGTELVSEDYDSIGGVLIEQLDHLPEDGEMVVLQDKTILKVEGMEQNRIQKVRLTKPVQVEEASEEEGENSEEEKKAKENK